MKVSCALTALLLIVALATPCLTGTTDESTSTEAATEATASAPETISTLEETESVTHEELTTVEEATADQSSTGDGSSSTIGDTAPTEQPTDTDSTRETTPKESLPTTDELSTDGVTQDTTIAPSDGTTTNEAGSTSIQPTDSTGQETPESSSSIGQTMSTRIEGTYSTPNPSPEFTQEPSSPSSHRPSRESPPVSSSAVPPESTKEPSSTSSQGPSSESSSASSPSSPVPPETTQSSSRSSTPRPTLDPEVGYTVPTPYGQMNGVTYTVRVDTFSDATFNTKRVSRFLGIPYALPPTQSRRFKSPVKVPEGSSTEVNATQHKPNCPQKGQTYDEDCLYYNVWTVQTAENANSTLRYPVLVYIHGGRFETGYSSNPFRQGEELVSHNNVVVVTFNYRLGALGFLTLNKTSYTGNYGIQDQKVAIEVIHEVIASFSGNQSQITLMGLDAGSASIGFHMMSSSTSAYFSRAIMMGGSPMMPWSLTNDLEYVQLLSLLFTVGGLKCESMEEPALTECLQKIPVSQLVSLQNNFTRFFQGLEFSPVVDGTTIPQDPWHAFSNGNFQRKDLLIGSTNDEGANMAEDSLEALDIPILGVNDSMLVSLIERSIAFYPRASRTLSETGRQYLRLHFTGYTGANDGKANFDTLGKAIGDWYLTCPVIQMAQFAEKVNPNVYLYYFTEKELNQDKWQASHGVDADYAFGVPTLSSGIIYPPDNKRLSERMMENFVQFAAQGEPTDAILWKPLNGSEMNYINYNADARILENYQRGYRLAECHFWNKTLAYVNDLERPLTTTTAAPTTTRPPIGPCDEWAFNSATGTTMGVLLATQVATAAALGFVLYKWKALSKVSSEPV